MEKAQFRDESLPLPDLLCDLEQVLNHRWVPFLLVGGGEGCPARAAEAGGEIMCGNTLGNLGSAVQMEEESG